MTDGFPPGLFLDGLVRGRLESDFNDGVKAWVHLYYLENTDAERIEGDALHVLDVLLTFIGSDLDVEELVREVEEDINRDGGVRSADTGRRHTVATYPPDPEDAG